jgi:queuine tRNA-ribosyltransferase
MLLTWHNLAFYQDVMREMRAAIAAGSAAAFAGRFLEAYRAGGKGDPDAAGVDRAG